MRKKFVVRKQNMKNFNGPTATDYTNSLLYSYERQKIKMFNQYLFEMPHIFSHVNVEISFDPNGKHADPNRNIYVRLIGSEEFCNQINCNLTYPRGKYCQVNQKPLNFKSGNSDISACQSACYNLFEKRKNPEGEFYRPPLVRYSRAQCKCLIQNQTPFQMATDDFVRTDSHPTPRVDTIGTGFDLDEIPYIDDEKNETFQFRLNKYYCDDFRYSFDGKKCESSVSEDIFSFLISENLYKFGQYGVRYAKTGNWLSDTQTPNLPPIRAPAPKSLDQWLTNVNTKAFFINPDLNISDLGIVDGRRHLIFTTEYGWPGLLVEPLAIYKDQKLNANTSGNKSFYVNPDMKETREKNTEFMVRIVDFERKNENLPAQFRYDAYGRREHDEYELMGLYARLKKIYENTDKDADNDDHHKLARNIVSIINQMATIQEAINFAGTIASQKLFDTMFKRILVGIKTAEKLSIKFTPTVVKIIQHSVAHNVGDQLGHVFLSYASLFFKTASTSLKTMSMFMDVGALLDLLFFAFQCDWAGLKNLQNQDFVNTYSIMDLKMNEQNFGFKNVELSPIYFIHNHESTFTRDSLMETNVDGLLKQPENLKLLPNSKKITSKFSITLENVTHKNSIIDMLKWQTDFLYNLKKNSDNLPIDWSLEEKLDISKYTVSMENIKKEIPHNFNNYKKYISKTLKRIDTIKVCLFGIVIAFILGIYFQLFIFISLMMCMFLFSYMFI